MLLNVKKNRFCKGCYDRKAQAASAQSFTIWQQTTIEITRRDHSALYYCVFVPFIHGCCPSRAPSGVTDGGAGVRAAPMAY